MHEELSKHERSDAVSWAATLGLLVVWSLLSMLALLDPQLGTLDPEEAMSPAQAVVMGWTAPDAWIGYGYRSFCGGCTTSAWLASWLFAVLPETALVWKLVVLAFAAIWVVAGHRLSARQGGAPAAWGWAVAACLLPGIGVEASLRGWMNHFEATAMGLALLAVVARPPRRREVVSGALLAAATLVVGLSGAFLVAVAVGWLAVRRETGRAVITAAGALVGGVAWWGLASVITTPPWRDLARIASGEGPVLAATRVLGQPGPILGGGSHPLHTVLGGLTAVATVAAVVVCVRRRAWLPVAVAGAWTLVYLASPYAVEPARDGTIEPLRYAIPLVAVIPFVVARAFGVLWSDGRRRLAVALLVSASVSGGLARMTSLAAVDPEAVVGAPAAHWLAFRYEVLPSTGPHGPWSCDGRRCRVLAAYRQGVTGLGPVDPDDGLAARAWWAGRGLALAEELSARTPSEAVTSLVGPLRAEGASGPALTAAVGEGLLLAMPRGGWRGLDLVPEDPAVAAGLSWAHGVRTGGSCVDIPETASASAWQLGCCSMWGARRADRPPACRGRVRPSWESYAETGRSTEE